MNKLFIALIVVVIIVGIIIFMNRADTNDIVNIPTETPATTSATRNMVANFNDCVAVGNPVMESYPRQCIHNGVNYTEFIGNEREKADLIRIEEPRPNDVVESPLVIRGQARGMWFFEATFPIVLTDWNGRIIAEGFATAEGNWMTEEFVPFEGTLTFTADPNVYSPRGSLILQRSNASGLPEHDDALEIPVFIERIE